MLLDVVDAEVEELGEAVVLLLEGDGGGEERGAGLVPEREGEGAEIGRVGVELAVVAVARRDGRENDGDIGEGDVDRRVALEIERRAFGGAKADAHDLEMKVSADAGSNGKGAGVRGEGAGERR